MKNPSASTKPINQLSFKVSSFGLSKGLILSKHYYLIQILKVFYKIYGYLDLIKLKIH